MEIRGKFPGLLLVSSSSLDCTWVSLVVVVSCLIVVSWGYSGCSVRLLIAIMAPVMACCRAQALGQSSAIVVPRGPCSCAQALAHRLNSYGAWV